MSPCGKSAIAFATWTGMGLATKVRSKGEGPSPLVRSNRRSGESTKVKYLVSDEWLGLDTALESAQSAANGPTSDSEISVADMTRR